MVGLLCLCDELLMISFLYCCDYYFAIIDLFDCWVLWVIFSGFCGFVAVGFWGRFVFLRLLDSVLRFKLLLLGYWVWVGLYFVSCWLRFGFFG